MCSERDWLAQAASPQGDGRPMLASRNEAYDLLTKLSASDRLLTHLELVGEAADELVRVYQQLGVPIDVTLVELGVAVHDAGKIIHRNELDGPGSLHENTGREMLLELGVQPEVAECCVSHGAWQGPRVSLEGRSVALADNLWKGKRVAELELAVIDGVAARLGLTGGISSPASTRHSRKSQPPHRVGWNVAENSALPRDTAYGWCSFIPRVVSSLVQTASSLSP